MLCKASITSTVLALSLFAVGGSARAGTITLYQGQDDGAAIGSVYTNSIAAQTSFFTAAGAIVECW